MRGFKTIARTLIPHWDMWIQFWQNRLCRSLWSVSDITLHECRSALYFTKDTKTLHQPFWQGCWKFSFLLKGMKSTVIVARGQWRNVAHSGCWWSFTSVEYWRMEACLSASLRISQAVSTWRTGKPLKPIFLFWLASQGKVGVFLAFL